MGEIKSYVERENYITIQGFMIKDLCLKGNELIIYAIIYGFSQLENQYFNGTLKYLAEWTNSTKQGVKKALKSLEGKGFIVKQDKYINNVKIVEYYTTKFNRVLNKVAQGMQQSLPNNIDDNIDDNIEKENRNNTISLKEKSQNKRFVKPKPDEIQAYCDERHNGIDGSAVWDFYESKGWKIGNTPMKDWKACVRTWERKKKEQEPLELEEEKEVKTVIEPKDSLGVNLNAEEKRQRILDIIRGKR